MIDYIHSVGPLVIAVYVVYISHVAVNVVCM